MRWLLSHRFLPGAKWAVVFGAGRGRGVWRQALRQNPSIFTVLAQAAGSGRVANCGMAQRRCQFPSHCRRKFALPTLVRTLPARCLERHFWPTLKPTPTRQNSGINASTLIQATFRPAHRLVRNEKVAGSIPVGSTIFLGQFPACIPLPEIAKSANWPNVCRTIQ